ncbi:XrtA/PEP-CTERM system TPR-repeat protein PrsT [Rhodospirillaceae bacterium SYSU D60014]|uniref:XrtA/PEP-CTERM system TPR-repeat protein PrsT n=1 Tax=Virgifigura deserti TaxID=2268457 RepID=UPI0013C40026
MRERRLFRPLLIGSALTALLALTAPFDASAVTVDQERSASYYQDALQQLEDGDAAAAIIQLRNALQQDPGNVEARQLLGRLYLSAGDGPSAEKELGRALEAQPSDETEILLGNALLMQQKYEEVLSTVSREASTPEQRQEKLLILGNAHFGLDEVEEAEAIYREILSSAPASVGANFALARLKGAVGDLDAASDYLSTALETDPEFFEGWLLKAEIALRHQQYDAAFEALDKADRIRPGNTGAMLARAQALLQTGKVDEGEEQVKAILERQPNQTFAKYLQAGIYFARGDYEEADRVFFTIQDELRNFTPALLLGGLIKFGTEQYAQAEQFLSRYVAAQPQNVAAKRVLALVNLRLGNPHATVRILESVVAANPDDLAAMQLLASGYMRTENYDQAAEAFEKVARSDNPAFAQQARTSLALLGTSLGISGAPVADAEEQAAAQPSGEPGAEPAPAGTLMPADELSRGIVLVLDYLKTRDFEAALDEVESLKSTHPDNPVVLNIEGGIHLARGDEESARESFEKALELNPDFISALNNLDRLDLRAGNPEAVEGRMRDRLERDPTDEQMLLRLAQFLTSQERPDEAQALLDSARGSMPESIAVREALVVSYLTEGTPERAVPIAKEMADIAPENPAVLTFAGRTLLQAEMPAEAVGMFERLRVVQPDSPAAQLLLADALFAAERKDEARAMLVDLRERNPENVPAAAGLINFALSDDQAEEALRIATDLAAQDAVASAQLQADVLRRTGRADKAVAVLSDAFQENPVSPLALDLFLAQRSVGQVEEGIKGLTAWVEAHPDDRPARLALASALIETGDYETASAQYETLVTSDPNDAAALNNLAWLKNELGEPNALDYARRAHDLAPESPEIADTLGWMLVQSEDTAEEGLALLREAATAAPANADIQYHLAYALRASGDQDEAQAILEKLLATDQPFTERDAAQSLLTELRG